MYDLLRKMYYFHYLQMSIAKTSAMFAADVNLVFRENVIPTTSVISSGGDCGMAKSSEPIKWQDSNTPTLTPYKAFSEALLL